MKNFYYILGALVILLVLASMVVAVGGSFMDPTHRAEVTSHINAPPDSIFALITDYRNYSSWRKDLLRVEMLPPRDTIQSWREFDKDKNNWAFEAIEVTPPSYLKVKIAEPTSPIQGTWMISIITDGTGSIVNVIEEATVTNVFFRFIANVFMSDTATIEAYLASLASRFGQTLIFK